MRSVIFVKNRNVDISSLNEVRSQAEYNQKGSVVLKKEYQFWLGGYYNDLGAYDTKGDAERGYCPKHRLDDLLDEFKEKKVKVTIEIIEE